MSIRLYKSYTPGTRTRALSSFSEITKSKPEKKLLQKNHRKKGRNNRGVITIRHRGGGHKRRYRLIDFKRKKYGIEATVASIEYDPNRNARIALMTSSAATFSILAIVQTEKPSCFKVEISFRVSRRIIIVLVPV